MKHLLSRMPPNAVNSFTEEQLSYLKVALAGRQWGQHSLDLRGTLAFPLISSRFYYVFLIGRNKRTLTRQEKKASAMLSSLVLLGIVSSLLMAGILSLYLLKSAAGIDLLPGFSTGVWQWWQEL